MDIRLTAHPTLVSGTVLASLARSLQPPEENAMGLVDDEVEGQPPAMTWTQAGFAPADALL